MNLLTNTDIGSIAFTAANGDILIADYTGKASQQRPRSFVRCGNRVHLGGTGRFAGATGSFIITRLFDLATNLTAGSFEGTISSPGAKPVA